MKILFITRNFPPQIGGLEKMAYYLYSYFKKEANVILLKWSGSRKLLIFVLPYFLIKALLILSFKKIDIIYLNEGFLSVLGIVLKLFKKPVFVTIHGLDITYSNKFYQFVIPKCISKLDKIICISQATKNECLKRGIIKDKICIIPDGFRDEFYMAERGERLKEEFMNKVALNIENKKILLSVCRLVERKGVHWFIDEVIPALLTEYKNFIYIVAGDGAMRKYIENIIQEKKLSNWVKLLGKVDNEFLKITYNIADIFVIPNIPVKGDLEGFGIVALEAASCKLPIVASDLEGIKDALLDGSVGRLVKPFDHLNFKTQILTMLEDNIICREYGGKARTLVLDNFRWDIIVKRYVKIFKTEISIFSK